MTKSVHQLPVNKPAKAPGKSEPTALPIYRQFPEIGFLRIGQIVKTPGKAEPPLIPVSRSTWLAGVKSGRFPRAYKLGVRTTAWRVEDIRKLIIELGGSI